MKRWRCLQRAVATLLSPTSAHRGESVRELLERRRRDPLTSFDVAWRIALANDDTQARRQVDAVVASDPPRTAAMLGDIERLDAAPMLRLPL